MCVNFWTIRLCSKPEIEFVSRSGYRNGVDSVGDRVPDRCRLWSDFVRQMRHFFCMPMAATPHNLVTSSAYDQRRRSFGNVQKLTECTLSYDSR